MALTLKLKAPTRAQLPEESVSLRKPSTTTATPPPLTPKIRLKPPSLSPLKRGATKENEPKHKKLKISLGKKNGDKDSEVKPKVVRNVPRVRVKPTRIPGEGYDSEEPGIEDDMLLEQGIAVRFLDDVNLGFIQRAVATGELSAVNLKWITREKAVFNINGTFYSARLVDLPTLTEIYKTTDKKNIFKTIDVCQLLLVLKVINPAELDTDKDFEVPPQYTYVHPLYKLLPKGELKQRHTMIVDGLTSPFVNVLRRFRPRKITHRVMEDIDARVRELIKLDDEAEESHFEVIDELQMVNRFSASRHTSVSDLHNQSPSENKEGAFPMSPYQDAAPGDTGPGVDGSGTTNDIEMDLEEELNQVFGGEDEEDLEEGMNAILEEEEDEEEEGRENVPGDEEEEEEEEDEDDEDDDDEDEDDDEAKADRQHAKLLENEIAELEKVVDYHRQNLSNATSKMMRMKFQNTYTSLKASLDQKKRSLAKINDEQQTMLHKLDPTNMHAQRHDFDEEEDEEDDDEDDGAGGEEADGERDANEASARDSQTENLDDLDDLF